MALKTHWLGSFARKSIVCTTQVVNENFRNGKIYEDKTIEDKKIYLWGDILHAH